MVTLGLQGDRSNHIAANAVTDQCQTFTVHANFCSVLGNPLRCLIGLGDGHREMRFW